MTDEPYDDVEIEQRRRAQEWSEMTEEERRREIQLMDEHVSFWERNRGVFGE